MAPETRSFAQLLRGPRRGGMTYQRDMNDLATLVREDDEHEQQPVGGGRVEQKWAAAICWT